MMRVIEKGLLHPQVARRSKKIMILRVLWTIAVILLVLWILGLIFHILGGFIHILLIIALIIVVYNFVMGSRRRAL